MDLDERITWTERVLNATDAGQALDDFANAVLEDYKKHLKEAIRERMRLLTSSDPEYIEFELLLEKIASNSIGAGRN